MNRSTSIIHAARGPVLLITIGFLFALHQAGIIGFQRTWPLLIIVLGFMKLLERTVSPRPLLNTRAPSGAGFGAQYPQQPPYPAPPPYPPPPASYPGPGSYPQQPTYPSSAFPQQPPYPAQPPYPPPPPAPPGAPFAGGNQR